MILVSFFLQKECIVMSGRGSVTLTLGAKLFVAAVFSAIIVLVFIPICEISGKCS